MISIAQMEPSSTADEWLGPTVVRPNDRIDIGPYALVFDGQALLPCSRVDNVELTCRNLRRVVKDAATGQPLTLLDDISLVVRPGEFVCVLGPSGSGKSTLLSALSARTPLEQGHVTINGQDLLWELRRAQARRSRGPAACGPA